MITALAGGVGAARFLTGLVRLVSEEELTVIVNTGDNMTLHGLNISPDTDIVTYTLAGVVDESKGWGIRGDTFRCLEALKKLGEETWFRLGDNDMATSVYRTALLSEGVDLSEVTARIARAFGLRVAILPMTNDKFETQIKTTSGTFHFEEYLVKRKAQDEVLGVSYLGVDRAEPAPRVLDAIADSELVVVCPSNPVVSIGTILTVKGIRDSLRKTHARKVAISPIVGGAPVKGPADKLLKGLGHEVSALGVAELYRDFMDTFVIDTVDSKDRTKIEELGVRVKVANTIMRSLDDKVSLAKAVLEG
jgi:LPPG:FO 2-phospho-L-lactate transferase